MLKTILVGSCVYVQGTFVRKLKNGKIEILVDEQLHQGFPVAAKAAA